MITNNAQKLIHLPTPDEFQSWKTLQDANEAVASPINSKQEISTATAAGATGLGLAGAGLGAKLNGVRGGVKGALTGLVLGGLLGSGQGLESVQNKRKAQQRAANYLDFVRRYGVASRLKNAQD